MKKISLKRLVLKLALLMVLGGPGIASAQQYFQSSDGDVDVTFRKLGSHAEVNEMVVYLGNVTDFLAVPAGNTITLTNVTTQVLTNMCPDNLNYLQWSVISGATLGNQPSVSGGQFPDNTVWYTVARTNVNVKSVTPSRSLSDNFNTTIQNGIVSIRSGAQTISHNLGSTNAFNNTFVSTENVNTPGNGGANGLVVSSFIDGAAGRGNSITGSFGKLGYSVENTNLLNTSVSDFYQNVVSSPGDPAYIDPVTGTDSGNC